MQTIIQNRKQRCKICERPRKREKLERTTDAPKTNISKSSLQKLKLKNQESHGCSKICITHLPIKDGNFTLGASLTKSLKSQSNSLSASKGINKIAVVTQGNSYTYHNVGGASKVLGKSFRNKPKQKRGKEKKSKQCSSIHARYLGEANSVPETRTQSSQTDPSF